MAETFFFDYLSTYLKNFLPHAQKIAFFYEEGYFYLAQGLKQSNQSSLSIHTHEMDIFNVNFELIDSYDFVIFFFDVADIYQKDKLSYYYREIIPQFKSTINKVMFLRDIGNAFSEIFACHPSVIAKQNKNLIQQGINASSIRITDNNGSNIIAEITHAKWTNLDGCNHRSTLLPSEISTFSPTLNGEIYFTGALQSQIPFGIKFGLITEANQIKIKIVNSVVTDITSCCTALDKALKDYVAYNKANSQVVELGIGTNTGIISLVGCGAPFEERYPGFHLGIGGSVKNSQHIDFIFDQSTIYFDQNVIFKNKTLYFNDHEAS